jgi:hypothetical protein
MADVKARFEFGSWLVIQVGQIITAFAVSGKF